jgi:hypothetical protein
MMENLLTLMKLHSSKRLLNKRELIKRSINLKVHYKALP